MTRSEFLHAASLAAALAALLTAGSCATPTNDGAITADPDRNFPITVAPAFKNITLSFAASPAGLVPQDEARFRDFVQDYLAGGNGSISVSVPKGPASSDEIRYFGERLASMGVARERILVGTRDLEDGDAHVELSFVTYSATTAPCGNWPDNVANTASNLPAANFGCATQHNLAAMVADPRDLVSPRALGAADASRRTTVMQSYERGAQTAAQKTADQSANVSGVQ